MMSIAETMSAIIAGITLPTIMNASARKVGVMPG